MRRRTGNTIAWTACAVFVLLLLLTFRLLTAAVRQMEALLPDAYQFSNAAGLGFTFGELSAASRGDADPHDLAAFAQKGTALLHYGEKVQQVRLMYVQGDAAGILGVRMLYGTFLRVQDLAPEENHFAVIEAALAQEFFFTPDCVGRTLEIDGTVYTICGVYEAASGWMANVCGDGLALVFLPASLSNVRTQRVEHVFYRSAGVPFVEAAKDAVATLSGQAPAPTYTGSHSENKSFLRQCVRLVCVLACAAACLPVLALPAGAFTWQEDRGISLNGRRLFAGAVLLAPIGLGWRASVFSLNLPAAWTPQDNIFDVSFYTEQFIDQWQAVHSGTANFFLNRCTLLAFGVCVCLTLLCAVWTACAAAFGTYAVLRKN